jgi:hypothetical protein
MRQRKLIHPVILDKAIALYQQDFAITTIKKLLEITTQDMSYRSFFDIIQAELDGWTHLTRPEWLLTVKEAPTVQTAPFNYRIVNGWTAQGFWVKRSMY